MSDTSERAVRGMAVRRSGRRVRLPGAAHPLQGLAEGWALGLTLAFLLSLFVGHVTPYVLTNGVLALCAVCGTWVALRARPGGRGCVWQVAQELALGLALALVMVLGVGGMAALLGLRKVATVSSLGELGVLLVLSATGFGYLLARAGVGLWRLWGRMRRRRMVWALTHAHLLVVAVVVVCGWVLMFLFVATQTAGPEVAGDPAARLFTELMVSYFPTLMVAFVLTCAALAVTLPPSALFSFLVARRSSRRLEALAHKTASLRQGDYGARVTVEGEDEVAQLQADFNAMAAELERTLVDLQAERDRAAALLQSRRELVAAVSHELRTPLATVRGYLDGLQAREALPDPARRDLEVVEREVLRLQALIDDLFTLARAEAGGLPLELGPTDVGETVRRRVEALAPLAWQRERVELLTDLPPTLPLAQADAGRLDQVLGNLVRNALRHTPPGGLVVVAASAGDDSVCIEVRDTGEGIPPEDLPHVWERFYRGQNARDAGHGGAGLGLALVKELVEAMGGTVGVESAVGGTVGVESAVGEGSRFRVCLPSCSASSGDSGQVGCC